MCQALGREPQPPAGQGAQNEVAERNIKINNGHQEHIAEGNKTRVYKVVQKPERN